MKHLARVQSCAQCHLLGLVSNVIVLSLESFLLVFFAKAKFLKENFGCPFNFISMSLCKLQLLTDAVKLEGSEVFFRFSSYMSYKFALVVADRWPQGARKFTVRAVSSENASFWPVDTWLILPAVICSDKRLSHACLRTYFLW